MKKNLNPKTLSRYAAVQAIYNLNFSTNEIDIKEYFLNRKEFTLKLDFDLQFEGKNFNKKLFIEIFELFNKKKDKIDELIKLNLDSNWYLERLPKVLHAILRVAISEMFLSPKISFAILISEYLKLTESFCSKNECPFTNAILQKIYISNELVKKTE
ncbi:MAG: transcription antitermination factor NusB [Rickettsiales bacterium]|nr:transcription antitermination factor NusB [Rickettsiales bacterium]